MLKIISCEIKNFKSFKDFKLSHMNNLTALIGANGVGKSNALDSIDFIGKCLQIGIEDFFTTQNKMFKDYIHLWNKDNNTHYKLTVLNSADNKLYIYELILKLAEHDTINIALEKFTVYDSKNTVKLYSSIFHSHHDGKLHLSKYYDINDDQKKLYTFLTNIKIYNFYSNNLIKHRLSNTAIEDKKYLHQNCSNLSSILFHLHRHYKPEYLRIVTYIKMILQGFEDFHFKVNEKNLDLQCIMTFSTEPMPLKFLSSGAIRFILLVIILNLPKILRPSVLMLEDPEIALHHQAINIIGDMIDVYSADSQIIIATQSPYLLNNLSLENLYVLNMDFKTGETQLSSINHEMLEQWLRTETLGNLWFMNLLGGNPI